MTTEFFSAWAVILAFDGVLMTTLTWMAGSKRYAHLRHLPPQTAPIPETRKKINTALNNVFSLLIFAAYFYFLGERTLYASLPTLTSFIGEVLGVLLVYDLMYYVFHRVIHRRELMRYCHNIHHRLRSPTSDASIFLHPLETFGGLGLLILAIVLLGPVSAVSFLAIFFIHSVVNIIVHSNLRVPHPAFRLFNFWVEKHNVHHSKARNNYASIFPFWDQAFGTAE